MATEPGIQFSDQTGWRIASCNLPALDDLGKLDKIEQACIRDLTERPARFAAIDLSQVNYMVTRGIGMLVGLLKRQRESGGTLVLCGMDPNVRRTFRIARLDRLFEIFPTIDALVAARPHGRPINVDPPNFGP